jgi:hypothetical protein
MDNKRKIVILCESYPSIAYTLYRLTNENGNIQAKIFFPTLKDLYRFFQVINKKVFNDNLELIYFPKYVRKWAKTSGIKKILYILPDILGERRHLRQFYNRHFALLEDADVLFPSPGYGGAKIYVLKALSRRNRLIFLDPGPPYMGRYSPRSIRDIAILLVYKIIYGKDIQIGQFPRVNPWSKGFPLVPDSFMKNSIHSFIDWSNRDEIMEDFDLERFRVFDTGDYKVIYFHQDFIGRYVPDRDTFSRELNNIFDVVVRYFPEKEIARKYHPGRELNKDVIEVGEELPAYIPAEFLNNGKTQIYLGISSTSITNVRRGQAISLIDLISFNSDKLRERFKERLIKASRSEILFPSSLEELERVISNISGKTL